MTAHAKFFHARWRSCHTSNIRVPSFLRWLQSAEWDASRVVSRRPRAAFHGSEFVAVTQADALLAVTVRRKVGGWARQQDETFLRNSPRLPKSEAAFWPPSTSPPLWHKLPSNTTVFPVPCPSRCSASRDKTSLREASPLRRRRQHARSQQPDARRPGRCHSRRRCHLPCSKWQLLLHCRRGRHRHTAPRIQDGTCCTAFHFPPRPSDLPSPPVPPPSLFVHLSEHPTYLTPTTLFLAATPPWWSAHRDTWKRWYSDADRRLLRASRPRPRPPSRGRPTRFLPALRTESAASMSVSQPIRRRENAFVPSSFATTVLQAERGTPLGPPWRSSRTCVSRRL